MRIQYASALDSMSVLRQAFIMTVSTVLGIFLSGIVFGTGVTYFLARSLVREAEDMMMTAQRLNEQKGKQGRKL